MEELDGFYKIKEAHIDYKGQRFFKFKCGKDYTTQVHLTKGNKRSSGKNECVGVYQILSHSFLCNYLPFYVERCTKKEFEKALNKTIKSIYP
jgi:hypothetical protein